MDPANRYIATDRLERQARVREWGRNNRQGGIEERLERRRKVEAAVALVLYPLSFTARAMHVPEVGRDHCR